MIENLKILNKNLAIHTNVIQIIQTIKEFITFNKVITRNTDIGNISRNFSIIYFVNYYVSGNAKPKQGTMKPELKRIRKVEYDIDPNRYELRSGSETNAPLCPYGNIYKWVVFDLKANEYVRFAKSVFKLLINKNGK